MFESSDRQPVSLFYKDENVRRMFVERRPGANLDACLEQVEGMEMADDPADWLDDLLPEQRQLAVCAIAGAVPDVVEQYGSRMLAWAHVNDQDKAWELREEVEIIGYDADRLTRAQKWANSRGTHRFSFIRTQYDFIQSAPEVIADVPLDEVLQNNPHPGTKFDMKQLENYSLQAYELTGEAPQGWLESDGLPGTSDMYVDGQVAAVLRYKDIPQLVTSFNMSYPTEMLVRQLQRLKLVPYNQSGRGWPRLDWTGALVDIATQVATNSKLDFIGVQSAENNHWLMRGARALSQQRAVEIYDDTAQRLGFWEGVDNDWHKRVSPLPEDARW